MAECKVSCKLSVKKLMFKPLLAVALASRGGYKNVVHNIFRWIHGFIDFNKYLGCCKFLLFLLLKYLHFTVLTSQNCYFKFWSNLWSSICLPSLGFNTGYFCSKRRWAHVVLKPLELTICVVNSAASMHNVMQLYLQVITLHNFSHFVMFWAVFLGLENAQVCAVCQNPITTNHNCFHTWTTVTFYMVCRMVHSKVVFSS